MKKLKIPLALLALVSLGPAHAEQMFVIDKVLLNVYVEPNQDSGRVATLETGDIVEAIDELEPYVRVRLPDGREGWVRANYLTKQAPAILRLKELQSGQPAPPQPSPQLLQELADLKQQNAALQGDVAQLKQEAAAKPAPAPAPVEVAKEAPAPVEAAKPAPAAQAVPAVPAAVDRPAARLWAWVAAVVVAGALGFLLGYQTLATSIKRKYGNIKVY